MKLVNMKKEFHMHQIAMKFICAQPESNMKLVNMKKEFHMHQIAMKFICAQPESNMKLVNMKMEFHMLLAVFRQLPCLVSKKS